MPYSRKPNFRSRARRPLAKSTVVYRKPRPNLKNVTLNPTVKKLVDRRISKSEQTHYNQFTEDTINFNGAINETDVRSIVQSIGHGDSVINRTGTRVKLVSCTIEGYLKFVPSGDADDAAYQVRMLVLSDREYPRYDQLFTDADAATNRGNVIAKFLKSGSTYTNYDGTWDKHCKPTNKEQVITHYDRKHNLVSDRTLYVAGTSSMTRNSVRVVIKPFKINLKVKGKVLKYNQGTESHPSNWNPVIMCGFINLETPDTVETDNRVQLNYSVTTRWKDI